MIHRASKLSGSCEHGNELSGSRNGGDFLTSRVAIGISRRILLHRFG